MAASFHATNNVTSCYTICSIAQGSPFARTRFETARRARLALGPADHGAARSAGPALDAADHVGAAGKVPDVARAARRLRRGISHRAAGTTDRIAQSRLHRPWRS